MKKTALKESDYNPFYKGYVDLVGESALLLDVLEKGKSDFKELIASIPTDKFNYAYAPNKWTVVEALLHVIDTERVFQYRALCFSRKDTTPLPGFEQNEYVPHSNASARSIGSIEEEFLAVRESTITLFKSFSSNQLVCVGMASNSPMSVAATGFIICGHQKHHANIVLERYLCV